MSKWNSEMVENLNNWCESRCTKYSKIYTEITENAVKVKRNNGNGRPSTLNRFMNNSQIENFLNEEKENNDILEDYNKKVDEMMGI